MAVTVEATELAAGWLAEQPEAAIRSAQLGEIQIDFNASALSALRHSGAMGLLTFWKVRRGGAA